MKTNKNKKEIIIILSIILFLLIILTLCVGKYPITIEKCLSIIFKAITFRPQIEDEMSVNVVLKLRLPRILISIFVGAALSISGTCYQSIFKNPLVSPDFLGVSTGACIGAASAILLGLTRWHISLFAFIGGIVSVIITSLIPKLINNRSNIMLVLSGIIVGSLMSSILGFIKFIADPDSELASITYWTMGSFSYSSIEDVLPMFLITLVPTIVLFLMSWWIDVLSLGEDEAKTLGARTKMIKAIVITCSTILTSAAICFAGTIGWVGLIVPHVSRLLVGPTNSKLIPCSCFVGAIFMLLVDTITRTIGVVEMPVSIMTGIVGAPFFCWLLYKKKDEII